jgi:hypothetical protein
VNDTTDLHRRVCTRIANKTLRATKTPPGSDTKRGEVQGEWEPIRNTLAPGWQIARVRLSAG